MPASPENRNQAPRAKKSLGQHFLRREEICDRIAALLLPQAEDRVLEIGPGPGALTRALEAAPHACLLLLEKDRHWAAERQRQAAPRTQAVLTDALRFDWRRISPEHPWKVIGNLPYNVASPLIWDIVSRAEGLKRAVFMVQKEVGQRLAAAPATATTAPSRSGFRATPARVWNSWSGPARSARRPRWIRPCFPLSRCRPRRSRPSQGPGPPVADLLSAAPQAAGRHLPPGRSAADGKGSGPGGPGPQPAARSLEHG